VSKEASVTFEEIVRIVTSWLANLADLSGAIVVGVAAVRGLLAFLAAIGGLVLRRGAVTSGNEIPKEEIRLSLARSLALALEFEVGADILRTVVTPSWNDIVLLGAIILLRTVLNYFLQRELDAATKRAAGMLATEPVRDQVARDGNLRTVPATAASEGARRG
jgi:uncharacterized membrane protein